MGGCFVGCSRAFWRITPFAILWSIWKERNNRIFRGLSLTSAELISKITLAIAKWALDRKEFFNFCLYDILINWELCMRCGPVKVRKSILWSPPHVSLFKFNVDGAARGKPGPAGIGGVLRNCNGDVLFMFSKYVGVCDSNEVEVLAILESLR